MLRRLPTRKCPVRFLYFVAFLSALLSARRSTLGSGATAKQKEDASTKGSAPGATAPAQMLSSKSLPEIRGLNILAAARVEVNNPRLRDRSSLLPDALATRAAVDVSATAAPMRFIM
mmetsp:Transcript_36215/g.108511  ORF Transcript_36215/g.108511 Transcript_36215/m.108511 type:complete len:117 (-) Transcript_36215:554-904(-)